VGILSVFFASKCVKNKCFWVFFEAKYAFFEAFLGVKNVKNRVLSGDFVSETV
jgi:ABC-type Zn2+ transport system substrate-binding protein/surface adhesin